MSITPPGSGAQAGPETAPTSYGAPGRASYDTGDSQADATMQYGVPSFASYGGRDLNPTPQAPPSKTMAGWALALGWIPILPGLVASVVLGCIVISRSKDGRDHGKKLAIAGFVGVACWLLLIVGLLVWSPFSAHRDASGQLTRGGDISIDALQPGDCGPSVSHGVTASLKVVPCRQPHTFEVVARFELPDGDYPGDDTVVRLSERGCAQRLAQLPALRDRKDLALSYLHPMQRTWHAQRSVVCMVNTTQPATGSALAPTS
jgi:hypothetical protein